MKFRMAPNSLFAVLLRSPWWISIAIALVFFAASQALFPPEFALFAATGGVPFQVLGRGALKRQWHAPSSRELEAGEQALRAMGWPAFSALLEQAFRREGCEVQRQQGAADLLLTRNGRSTLVCARRWKAAHHGMEALQALRKAADARDDGSACLYVALGALSPQAQRFAAQAPVQLLQGAALVQRLRGLLPSS